MGSDDESKLAAPKLFGRKRSGRTPPAAAPAPDAEVTEAEVTEPEVTEPEATEPEVTESEGAAAEMAEPTEVLERTSEPAGEPESAPEPTPEPTAVLEPVPGPSPEPARRASPKARERATRPPKPAQERPARQPEAPKPERSVPILSGTQAAAFAGLLVGAFLVLATYGSLNLCSTVRGASTCGGGAGFPLLLAIGIVAVVGGAALLRAFRVTSALGDSFLAVALVAVLTVLFLHNHYDAWWMIIAVPVLSILAFLLAHWVSATYIDPMDD